MITQKSEKPFVTDQSPVDRKLDQENEDNNLTDVPKERHEKLPGANPPGTKERLPGAEEKLPVTKVY